MQTGARPQKVHNTASLSNRFARAGTKAVIAERLIQARELNGYQQTEAAERLGYKTSSQLSQWEHGKRMPPLTMLIKACETYRVSMDFLVGISDDPDRDPTSVERRMVLAGAERMLHDMSQRLADAVVYQTNLGGPTVEMARVVLRDGEQFMERFNRFVKDNGVAYEQMRWCASMTAAASDLEETLVQARSLLDRHRRITDAAVAGVIKQVRPHDQHPLWTGAANET